VFGFKTAEPAAAFQRWAGVCCIDGDGRAARIASTASGEATRATGGLRSDSPMPLRARCQRGRARFASMVRANHAISPKE
jgi:hypothetical protein